MQLHTTAGEQCCLRFPRGQQAPATLHWSMNRGHHRQALCASVRRCPHVSAGNLPWRPFQMYQALAHVCVMLSLNMCRERLRLPWNQPNYYPWNSEKLRMQNVLEINWDKAQNEQCREVLSWHRDSYNWPRVLRNDAYLVTALQGGLTSVNTWCSETWTINTWMLTVDKIAYCG